MKKPPRKTERLFVRINYELCFDGFLAGVLEQDHEQDANHECISREDVPGIGPVGGCVEYVACVHNRAGGEGADGGAEAVCHHHEQALGTGTDVRSGVLLNVKGT